MPTDLNTYRMQRCANTPEGHRYNNQGVCQRCGLTIHPLLRLAPTT